MAYANITKEADTEKHHAFKVIARGAKDLGKGMAAIFVPSATIVGMDDLYYGYYGSHAGTMLGISIDAIHTIAMTTTAALTVSLVALALPAISYGVHKIQEGVSELKGEKR
jgi:hypothetical protein